MTTSFLPFILVLDREYDIMKQTTSIPIVIVTT